MRFAMRLSNMQSSNVRLMPRKALVGQSLRSTCTNGTRCRAFFNFGNKGNNAQTPVKTRGDFTEVEVSDYFEYTGMLAEEGNYDRMDAMLATGEHPINLLLLMASGENDIDKVEELLKAGADPRVKDMNGKSAEELTTRDDLRELLRQKL